MNKSKLTNDFYVVNQTIVDYMNALQSYMDGDFGKFQEECYEKDYPIIDIETAHFLKMLIALKRPKKILEIGCAVGFSSMLMAETAKFCEEITTIDRYDIMIEKARANFAKFNKSDKINLIEGDALDVTVELVKEQKKYDFIFLDSAKGQYVNMLPTLYALLNDGGVLIADDIFQNGNIVKPIEEIEKRQRTIHRRMNEFLKILTTSEEFTTSIIPIADGVVVAVKN